MISGAIFLFFPQVISTLPPQVLTEGSYELVRLVRERAPVWSTTFGRVFSAWRQQQDGSHLMIEALSPLKGSALGLAWLTYPATTQALDDSAVLVAAAGMSFDDLVPVIDFDNASGELIRHIMLEKYLELGEDVGALFDYCSELFEREPLQSLLVKAYLLRMRLPFLNQRAGAPILLTNHRLLQFLDALPAEGATQQDSDMTLDVISWEFFRQILSPRLDPIVRSAS